MASLSLYGGTIVTDVTMVASGITKAFSTRMRNEILCYLNEEETLALSTAANITRSQAGIRFAIEKHPNALFVVGNAPTALMEINHQLVENPDFHPIGIIGVPVGFVNVIEAKEHLSHSHKTDWITLLGSRGGSNVAAAIVNAAYSLDEAHSYLQEEM